MKNEFAPYDLALAMKELGFDEFTVAAYVDNELDIGGLWKDSVTSKVIHKAPTYSQAFRWFREKYSLYHIIALSGDVFLCTIDISSWTDKTKTYDEAELACLKKLIEIVKNKESV